MLTTRIYYVDHKDLYGLKKAPRALYERLQNYLVKISFEKIDDNNNMYLKIEGGQYILVAKFFIDDIIFGGQDILCKEFENKMKEEFEISTFGEIKFFVSLQV